MVDLHRELEIDRRYTLCHEALTAKDLLKQVVLLTSIPTPLQCSSC